MTEKDLEIQRLRRELISAENRCKAYNETVKFFVKEKEKWQVISEQLAAENEALKAEIKKSGRANNESNA